MSSALTFSYDCWRETQRMTYNVMSNGKWDQWRHAVMLVIIRPPRERETKPPPRKGGRYLKPCSNKVFLSLYTDLSLNPQIRNDFMRSVKMGRWDSESNPIQIKQKLSVAVSFCLMGVYFGWIKPLFGGFNGGFVHLYCHSKNFGGNPEISPFSSEKSICLVNSSIPF